MSTPLNDPVTTLAELREDVRELIGTRYRDEARKSADEAKAVKHHFDAMVDAVDGVFTDSVPTYLQKTGPNGLDATYAQVDVAPTGTLEGDRTAVIAACLEAKDAGRLGVNLAPGHYRLDGLTVTDIYDRYLIGDNVTFTKASYVYPFRTDELITKDTADSGRGGGRGAIAFEIDDSQDAHWETLFPFSKELGVPWGCVWHTSTAPWVHEAVRHGWEAISHLPYDVDSRSLPLDELEDLAVESLDALEAVTGTREGHSFVYPRHQRNFETDRVLSKYYASARINGGLYNARPMDAPNPWGYQSYDVDGGLASGEMTPGLQALLHSVAVSNSKVVFLSHWRGDGLAEREAGFRKMIAYARKLGIDIKLSSQLTSRSQLNADPYGDKGMWRVTTTTGAIDTDVSYHGGVSFRATPATSSTVMLPTCRISTPDSVFTVLRIGMRIKTDGAKFSSPSQGIKILVQGVTEDEQGSTQTGATFGACNFLPGDDLPAQEWKRYRKTIVVGPGFRSLIPYVSALNLTEGTVWMDEFHIDVLGTIPELVVEHSTSTLNGTAASVKNAAAFDLRTLPYQVEEIDDFTGTPVIIVQQATVDVRSTEPTDQGKRVRIVFKPATDWVGTEWSDEGA